MTDISKTLKENWQDSVNIVLGLWLVISPWILQFAGLQTALGNAIVVGALIALTGLAALVNFRQWEEWLSIVIGLWLIASPWVLGFAMAAAATWNFVILGVVTAALAAWSLHDHTSGTRAA